MIPVSLRLRNFMSYGEHVPPLDFSSLSTACLTGDNGHGKSALLDAITWVLWGQTRAKTVDDIVRLGQDEAEVEFVFDLEDERYRVLRKRSLRTRAGQSSLELQGFDRAAQNYRSLSGNSVRETEAKIVQLLHMNYETFINSVFILQGRADEFTTRRPGERKRILAEILGLAVFDELEARARMRRGVFDQELQTLTQRVAELQQEVARKDDLAAAVRTHEETLAAVHADIQQTQEQLEHLRQRHSALALLSQRADDLAQRLQPMRHEQQMLAQQIALHTQRQADYEAVLQQESTIVAAYDQLLQLREQEQRLSAKAEAYTTLQQRLTTLQQALTTAQHRVEIELHGVQQRLHEVEQHIQACETIVHDAPRIVQAYRELQQARGHEAEMASILQQRYALEQEKSQVERRIQQKRHELEKEQHALLGRQEEWQRKGAALPKWQRQAEELRQQLATIEQHATRLDQIRSAGVALKVQVENTLPQQRDTLVNEIHEQEEKRTLLTTAGAHCPLCEKPLTTQERQRVIRKFEQEIRQRQERIRALHDEQQRLQAERQTLRLEYRQLEQQVEQRKELDQQYAANQVSLQEAMQAHEHLTAVLQSLQALEAQLQVGSYAPDELVRLQHLTSQLDRLIYDPEAHAALKQSLSTLVHAEVQQARLQQAEADVASFRQQQQVVTQQLATLAKILRHKQFALAEQQEIQEVTEALARLDFHPTAYHALRQQLQEHQAAERQYLQLEAARQGLTEERAILRDLTAKQQRLATEIAELEREQRQFASEVEPLEAIRHEVQRTEALLRTLREREGETRFAYGRSQSAYEHCLQREIELQNQQQKRQQAAAERTLYGDLAQIFGKNGVQAIIIENAIPELEDEANRILGRVTNNAMHLTLETQRDTRAGGVVETLDIKISDDLGTRNYELYSGGEAFRINFALRIALSKMLAQRAGTRLRTLVIDEGFGTQDMQGLERLVEVIKAIQGDFAKIIVITHLRELKNAFETHIEVKKDPVDGSMYQVV